MSTKNSNYTIGNRTREIPGCSAVPQPTAPPRTPVQMFPSVTLSPTPQLNLYRDTNYSLTGSNPFSFWFCAVTAGSLFLCGTVCGPDVDVNAETGVTYVIAASVV
jgi:hypothetical protein